MAARSDLPAPTDPFAALDATAQAALVREGDATPLELVDAALARLDRLGDLNVAASVDPERARRAAREVRRGAPLAGVPFLLKDLLPYPGLPLGCGSRLLAGQASPPAPDLARAFDDAGLVVLGKSTTSEFGLLGTTETLACGATLNPWDPARSPAGSSGGSAAAVAAGIVPVAHASDGGGSIRIPASVCGVVGLKPSRGRQRDVGMPLDTPLAALVVDHCVSRSVRDSAALLGLTQRRDATAPWPPLGPEALSPSAHPRRLRIGVYARTGFDRAPAPEIRAGLDAARRLCEGLGHETIEVAGPRFDAAATRDAIFLLFGATLGPLVAQVRGAAGEAALPALLEPFTLELVERAEAAGPAALAAARAALDVAAREGLAFLDGLDAALSPTTAVLPFPLDTLSPRHPVDRNLAFTEDLAGYTAIHSITGAPAMSVPLHWTAGGLPVGMQLVARPGDEALLLQLAYALEAAAPWKDRWPPRSAVAVAAGEGPWRSA
ncbi:Amidase [Anaeromyxobacter dehalogenans 2CP-1]|uniref:Amidase n=1 Tax=Anaeromyxobacter dehalogenans (strain ATCC BAA-258 / DSM 21875 / 2CP-1) TaxID=455488 RepID=B8JG46_ANAD2|nr:amidase family protein [Anaeromyxobacter dehalogenans]ACL66449.1 Amidase [Anaeromyxobacter dehalogenans 2CP-1]